MRTVAVCNQKGGSCKTSTTVSLAGCLAELGQRVLIIDMDPQADSSNWFGKRRPPDKPQRPGLLDVLLDEAPLADAIEASDVEGIDIAPSHIELATANKKLVGELASEHRLKNAVRDLNANWDWIFIDCPPGIELLTTNALAAAEDVLIPTVPRSMDVEGVPRLMHFIATLKRYNITDALEVLGLVICQYDARQKAHRQIEGKIQQSAGGVLFKTRIRKNVRMEEAPQAKLPIHLFAPRSASAKDYRALTKELISRRPV